MIRVDTSLPRMDVKDGMRDNAPTAATPRKLAASHAIIRSLAALGRRAIGQLPYIFLRAAHDLAAVPSGSSPTSSSVQRMICKPSAPPPPSNGSELSGRGEPPSHAYHLPPSYNIAINSRFIPGPLVY